MSSQIQIAELYKSCSKDIFGVCYYVLKDEKSSMDIVMDTFEVALNYADFGQLDNPRAWLMKVARNLSLKLFHKQKKVQYDLDQRNIAERFMENDDLEEHITKEVLEEKLIEEIGMLKPAQSLCIELFYLDGRSYQEISDKTDMEVKAVKSHIQNGRRNLGLRLKAHMQ